MNPRHPMCRAIEPDLLSIAAGETDSAATGRVEMHVGGCQLCRDELAHYGALQGVIDSLRRAPLADEDATLARARLAARLSDLRSRVPRHRKPRKSDWVRRRPRTPPIPAGSGTLDHVERASRTGASGRLRSASQKHWNRPRARNKWEEAT
jgi:anti-sigma factor RsiW